MSEENKKISCQKAEGMVGRYISRTLTIDELEAFLEHIESCSSCYDELETYFIVDEVTNQLDDDEKEEDLDFRELLSIDIQMNKKRVKRNKIRQMIFSFGVSVLVVMLAIFLIFIAREMFT